MDGHRITAFVPYVTCWTFVSLFKWLVFVMLRYYYDNVERIFSTVLKCKYCCHCFCECFATFPVKGGNGMF